MLQETIERIKPADREAMKAARAHWDAIAKPLRSLGRLEEHVIPVSYTHLSEGVHSGRWL